jgi:alpha-L-fucosidase
MIHLPTLKDGRSSSAYTHGQIEELVTGYGPIDILWLDAGQVRPPTQDIHMDRLVGIARQYQPRLIVVDRTVGGRHENYRTPEQEVPDKPLPYVWETCMTMGNQWSFRPGDQYKSTHQLICLLVDIVGKGGNFLLNVGPQPDGKLPEAAQQRMSEIGDWLRINGAAIYGTRPISPYKEGQVVFTHKRKIVYAVYLTSSEDEGLPDKVIFSSIKLRPGSSVRMLGWDKPLRWSVRDAGRITIEVPEALAKKPPSRYAFAFQMEVEN